MNKPLDELYFEWLYGQVASVKERNPSSTYWKLLRQLYTKEFVWIIPNDDNRSIDGKALRHEFLESRRARSVDEDWLHLGCSMLELLIGLSRRLAFEDDGHPTEWFWKLIENLELGVYNDSSVIPENEIDDILNRVIWRTYKRSGRGGLFPLKNPQTDQREVEIWYQLSAYLLELETE